MSVAQETVHQCKDCGRTPDMVRFRNGGTGKLRKYCEECSAKRVGTRGPRHPSIAEDPAMTHNCAVCGNALPQTAQYFNYTSKPKGLLKAYCKSCEYGKTAASYIAETPRDRAIVPARTEVVTLHGRNFTVGWHEGATYWPVKPFIEAAGMDWAGQERRIKADSRLAQGIEKLSIPTPGGPQPMLCLPWASWHFFWSGTHSPKAERWRQEAYDALRLVFGETAGEVLQEKPVVERIADAVPRQLRDTPSPSMLFDRDPERFRALVSAYEQAQAAKEELARSRDDAASVRAQAEGDEERARAILAAAAERRERAATREAIAATAADEAARNLAAIKAQIDALWAGTSKMTYFYVRVYGIVPEPDMLVIPQVEVGESGSIAKNDGNAPPPRWALRKPCDDAFAIQEFVRKHIFGWYRVKGRRDHMFDLDGRLFWRLIKYLDAVPVLTLEYVRRFVPLEGAA